MFLHEPQCCPCHHLHLSPFESWIGILNSIKNERQSWPVRDGYISLKSHAPKKLKIQKQTQIWICGNWDIPIRSKSSESFILLSYYYSESFILLSYYYSLLFLVFSFLDTQNKTNLNWCFYFLREQFSQVFLIKIKPESFIF